MSPLLEKPILHGRDHCPGGADPIPCMPLMPGGSYAAQVLANPDLVHYWRMGAASGDQPDESGHPGGPVDLEPIVTGESGIYDATGALSADDDGAWETDDGAGFTGAGDYFVTETTSHRAAFVGSVELTVEAWIYPFSALGTLWDGGVVSCGAAGSEQWAFRYGGGGRLQFQRDVTGAYSSAGLVTPDEWNYVAVTYDGSSSRFYVNGGLAWTEANATPVPGGGQLISVGMQDSSPSTWFGGKIDEVALYIACLSAGEILAHYEAGISATGGVEGLVLTSDGAGGTSWQLPTFATYLNGA